MTLKAIDANMLSTTNVNDVAAQTIAKINKGIYTAIEDGLFEFAYPVPFAAKEEVLAHYKEKGYLIYSFNPILVMVLKWDNESLEKAKNNV